MFLSCQGHLLKQSEKKKRSSIGWGHVWVSVAKWRPDPTNVECESTKQGQPESGFTYFPIVQEYSLLLTNLRMRRLIVSGDAPFQLKCHLDNDCVAVRESCQLVAHKVELFTSLGQCTEAKKKQYAPRMSNTTMPAQFKSTVHQDARCNHGCSI